MDDVAIARAAHVLAVVIWIGGVSLVTTVVLPLVRRRPPLEQWALFEAVERRFVWQARIAMLLVGASGFYMAWKLDLWDRFRQPGFWWMHAMVLVWLLFAVVLFVGEPLGAERWLRQRERMGSRFRLCRLAQASLDAARPRRGHRLRRCTRQLRGLCLSLKP